MVERWEPSPVGGGGARMPGVLGWMRWGGRNTALTFSPFSFRGRGCVGDGVISNLLPTPSSSFWAWSSPGLCLKVWDQRRGFTLLGSGAAKDLKELNWLEIKKGSKPHPFCSSACKPSREKPCCLCPPVPSDVSSRTLGGHSARCEGLSFFFPCPLPPVRIQIMPFKLRHPHFIIIIWELRRLHRSDL